MSPLKVPSLEYNRIEVTDEFISKNNLVLRTPEEIKEKYLEFAKSLNPFDIRYEVLMDYVSLVDRREAYITGYVNTYAQDGESDTPATIQEVAQDFLDYLVFSWGKVRDENDNLSKRLLKKLQIWCWLLNRDELAALLNTDELYDPFGAPTIVAVSETLGLIVPNPIIKFAKAKCDA